MNRRFLTAEFAGTGGHIKEAPEDFRVEEIPLYQPSGEGEHLYLSVEKKGLTTHQLLRRAAEVFSVPERDIGYAGLKDSRATTVQTISIPLIEADIAKKIENDRIRLISAVRHRNKLKPGHLAGNRFQARIADPQPGSLPVAGKILSILQTKGVPNYFGTQRYGVLGNSHQIGLAILRNDFELASDLMMGDPDSIDHHGWKAASELYSKGRYTEALQQLPAHCRYEKQLLSRLAKGSSPRKAFLDLPRNILRLYLSACQSSLFDRIVEMRLATIDRIWSGDIAMKHANGACFRVPDPGPEQARADRFEISATGPLYGHKVMLARNQSGILEESLLDKEKLSPGDFKLARGLAMPGERRALRVPVSDVGIQEEKGALLLSFTLPKGSYATSLLREIIK